MNDQYNIKIIFKTKHAKYALIRTRPQRKLLQTTNSSYNISCERIRFLCVKQGDLSAGDSRT
jgi:hypothetical protein